MSDQIDGLNLSTSFFQEALRSALKTDSTPSVIGVKRLDEGQGYLSVIAQLKLKWNPSQDDNKLPSSVVVKIPTLHKMEQELERMKMESDAEMPPFDEFLLLVHNSECNFYRHIGKNLIGNFSVPLGHVYSTKLFDCTTELRPHDFGLIIIEDFVGRGRTPDFLSETFSVAQVESLISSIASVHAYCLTNPNWNEKKMFEVQSEEKYGQLAQLVKGGLVALRTQYPEHFNVSDDDIDKVSQTEEMFQVLSRDPNKIDYTTVLVHGDLWTNNTIFAIDEKNKVTDQLLAIIDWQTTHPGPVTEDFTRLMTSSVDPELRRANTDRWLQLYYKLLGEKLPKGFQIPFAMDEVRRMYKKTFRMGTLFLSMHIPLMLSNPQIAALCTEEQRLSLVVRMRKNIEDSVASLA